MRTLPLAITAALLAACSGSSSTAGSTGTSGSTAATSTTGSSASSGSGSTGSSTSGSSTGSTGASACAETTVITSLSPCQSASTTIDVPQGCVPNVDGTLHTEEWSDAQCFTSSSGDTTFYVKYARDAVYLATSGDPTCGCGMPFAFDPNGGSALDGDEFAISVFDDPFSTNGDRSDFTWSGSAWGSGTAPAGIVTACPGSQPSPIAYEWKIPFSALGITAGSPHTFKLAQNHNGKTYPLSVPVTNGIPDPSQGGSFSSSRNWQ